MMQVIARTTLSIWHLCQRLQVSWLITFRQMWTLYVVETKPVYTTTPSREILNLVTPRNLLLKTAKTLKQF